jgi:Holliday junction resolvasome RuvABC endonuclease subunit
MANKTRRTTALRTLAIDPGTREMGFAVLESTDLLYFGVHTFKHRRSVRGLCAEGQQFIRGLLDTFAPQVFVIEKTWYAQSKRSARLRVFVEAMQRCALQHGLITLAYTPTMVKRMVCGRGDATKREVAETRIRQRYPYQEKYLTTDLRTRERYWQNMFDAVALGLTECEEGYKKRMALTASRRSEEQNT